MFSRKWISRAVAVCAPAALLVGLSNPAQATGDDKVNLRIDGHTVGSIAYKDSGDKFTLCDLYPDDKGVQGRVYIYILALNEWHKVREWNKGGANTCETNSYDILNNQRYWVTITRNGNSKVESFEIYGSGE
ncbi:hypothetical protein PV726_49535 [Streptomyces europaeiscabiei]|uniref:hypothetical protein n=1 Tax=Streptomyces europaeiscabiei TaxID=146819 RepID=UPI0029B30239|nr:hypothetical protein [Streptomyces europaeiscabiei]MDX3698049.1 hypothetical protein [Streptomyces europaeiscabiei]